MTTYKKIYLPLLVMSLATLIYMGMDAPNTPYIQVETRLNASELAAKGVNNWPLWHKEPSTFVWQFPETEYAYVLQGKVLIRAEGSGKALLIKAGDFVTFAPGLRTQWQVIEPFKKRVTHEDNKLRNWYWRVAFKVQIISRKIKAVFAKPQTDF